MKLEIPEVSAFEDWTIDEMPLGFAMPGGVSEKYLTGGWRSMRPLWKKDACTNCLMCWIACPDLSIQVRDGQMCGIDYDHCKGCGICIHECRFNSLELIREDEASKAEGASAASDDAATEKGVH